MLELYQNNPNVLLFKVHASKYTIIKTSFHSIISFFLGHAIGMLMLTKTQQILVL